ncbi:MAG: hypothetical protein KGS61_04825 [Verrucomicrobia bacterium]|nr:hypothetical protein [Verrucomicrobiota bacterium]
MKRLLPAFAWLLTAQLGFGPLLAQPVFVPSESALKPTPGSAVTNLRVVRQSSDGTEVELSMNYTYDGFAGPSAMLVPVIEKRNQKGVSGWFGCDPVSVGQGKGIVSVKVKYFNDEAGVPPQFTSDRIRLLFLNQAGTAIVGGAVMLKMITWGSPNAQPAQAAPTPSVAVVPGAENQAQARRRAEERTQQEARHRATEEKAKAEVAAAEAKRQQAVAEKQRLAEEQRVAKEKAQAQAKAREAARVGAEAEAKKLAGEKRAAEEQARAEAKARKEARLKAEAEEKARRKAETKAKAEADAREKARLKAEAEAKRLAQEKAKAEEKAKAAAEEEEKARLLAEAKARETAERKAEAEAKRLAEEKRRADEKAKAEAKIRETARLKAEAEEKARLAAEEKAQAEAKAREEARLKAEAEAKRLAEEKRVAEQKEIADEKVREAAQAKAEAEAKRLAEEQRQAEAREKAATQPTEAARLAAPTAAATTQASSAVREAAAVQRPPANPAPATEGITLARDMRSKITNVDIVNRSLDRSQMTIGVEFEYRDNLGPRPELGVDVARSGDPSVRGYFHSSLVPIGRSRRNFALFPVKFQPPAGVGSLGSFATDQLLVYLTDADVTKRAYLFIATMLLTWRNSGAVTATAATGAGSSMELDSFKQNDLYSGFATVHYNLAGGPGKMRLRLYDSANPASADWFACEDQKLAAGRGLQMMAVSVKPNAPSPTALLKADTVEIDLLDASGKVVATIKKVSPMTWAKPQP